MGSATPRPMTVHMPSIIKMLAEVMYSDPGMPVRELLQNANDSCVLRQADDPRAPTGEIYVKFDNWSRRLSVEDNGAGLTEDEVKEFLGALGIGKSDQIRVRLDAMGQRGLSERLIGRFGLGLLSAFKIADRIEFASLSYKDGAHPIRWECDGGHEYRIGPAVGQRTPGTTVTLDINPKYVGMLEEDKLKGLIHLFGDLLEVLIYLNSAPQPVNAITAPWNREAAHSEYLQFATEWYPNDIILAVIPVKIDQDNGQFRVGGVLLIPEQSSSPNKEDGGLTVYVRRMYVCDRERFLLPDWADSVKGIIESPNLHETSSRDAVLRDEDFERARTALGEVIITHMARIATDNPDLFRKIITNNSLLREAFIRRIR